MALDDSAVYIPGTGHVYIAPTATALPASLTAPASPWEELGHTSHDDGLKISRDGGKSEVLGTWQNASLRERRDPTNFAIGCHLQQVDNNALEMYFGPGDVATTDHFGVTSAVGVIEKALYVRIIDGTNEASLYVPKVSISSDDDVEIDPEKFLTFPVKMTVLQVTGSNLMTWIAPELGAP